MLTVLGWILTGITLIGTYIVAGVETVVNAVFAAIGVVYGAAVALLPSMSDAPAIPSAPTWLAWLNWFYPVGDLLAGFATLVTMWIAYLAIRYVLRLVRGI